MTDAIRRAERAQRLLDDPMIAEAREHMRDALTRAAWKRHEYSDADRAKLDAYMRHFDSFFGWFDRAVTDGRIAEADIVAKSKLRQIAERARSKF